MYVFVVMDDLLSCGCDKLFERVENLECFPYKFLSFGGRDAAYAATVYLFYEQEGVAVAAQEVADAVRRSEGLSVSGDFSVSVLKRLRRDLRSELGLEPVFFDGSDYIGFYGGRLDVFTQERLCGLFGVSETALRYTYKELVEGLTGRDTDGRAIADVALTRRSFGYTGGGGVEDFALHIFGKAESKGLDVLRRRPTVLAAACLYVAGQVI